MRKKLWKLFTQFYPIWLRWHYGMHIGKRCRISWKARLDKTINPQGIYIGDDTWILSGVTILAHDRCRNLIIDTHIGNNCVIGVQSIIMPGVHIEDQVIVGGGSVVTRDVPSHSIVAGNPAKIIKGGICVQNGQII